MASDRVLDLRGICGIVPLAKYGNILGVHSPWENPLVPIILEQRDPLRG